MKVKLYAVYDSVSGIYDGPLPCVNDGVILRDFTNMANNLETKIGKNPEHFSVWHIGGYDDSTGKPKALDVKVCLAHAVDLLYSKKENLDA